MSTPNSPDNIIHPSVKSFQSEVLESDLPTLLDFWAPWCPPCRLLKPELEKMAPELVGRANVAFVNVDDHPAIAEAFQVSGIPALYIIKGGKVIDAWTGYSPRASVLQRLESHLA